jgi:hypothetical protein
MGQTPEQAVAPPRKRTHGLTAFGRTQSLSAWARESGIPLGTIRGRMKKAGLTLEEALRLRSNRGNK